MPRTVLWTVFAMLLAAVSSAIRAQDALRPRKGTLEVGDPAPDFQANDLRDNRTVRLSERQGKPTVLIFGSCT